MPKMVSADDARRLVEAATPGPWRWKSYLGNECDALTRDDESCSVDVVVLDLGNAEPYENRHGTCLGDGNREIIAAAPDLAATVLDLHKRLAAERCEPEGAASERWGPCINRWIVNGAPCWGVRRSSDGDLWFIYRDMEWVNTARYAIDAMRWCDEQDGLGK